MFRKPAGASENLRKRGTTVCPTRDKAVGGGDSMAVVVRPETG